MLLSRSNNNKIKHLHERCLRIVYQDKQSSYENLLLTDGTVSMHHRNIQALAIEMYKIKNDLSTEILSNIFTQRTQNHYSLGNASDFQILFVRTVYHGTESISYQTTSASILIVLTILGSLGKILDAMIY